MSFGSDILADIKGFPGELLSDIKSTINDPVGVLRSAFDMARSMNQDKKVGADLQPGDVNISSIMLVDNNGQKGMDIMSQVTEINIYESILSPVMYCTMFFNDGIRLHEKFSIDGFQSVAFTLATPGDREEEYEFVFSSMSAPIDKKISNYQNFLTYRINFCSPEAYTNARNMITDFAYKDNVKNVITKVFKQYIPTKKHLHIDDTKGIEQNLVSLVHPFQAINHLKHIARSVQYDSHLWVFFQNRDGFYFTTIEKLMWDGSKSLSDELSDREFFFDTVRNDDVTSSKYRNIISYNKIQAMDPGATLVYGGLTGIATGVNLKTFALNKSVYNKEKNSFVLSDKGAVSTTPSDFVTTYGGAAIGRKFLVTNDIYGNNDTAYLEKVNRTRAYVVEMTQNITQIEIYGDFEIKAGDVIKINLPSSSSLDEDKNQTNKIDSGNYLVAAVRHMIMNTDRPQHIMALELLRAGLPLEATK